jgi:lipoprotein-releasing system ATP-binding protein
MSSTVQVTPDRPTSVKAVEVLQLSKSYGKLQLLKSVSLELSRGELVAVVGPSGSGKSTLLHLLGGLLPADSGTIRLNGRNLGDLKGDELADFRNRNLGFVFQQSLLLPEFTAEENLMIPALIGGTETGQARAKARELAGWLGVADRLDHKPNALSGGEQQRFAVARALMNQPGLILADEPSGNLDHKQAGELHALFGELRNRFHQTLLVVTHNTEMARSADRVLELSDGTVREIHPKNLA